MAEAASLTTAATHHLLTELLVRVAHQAPARDVALSRHDLDELATLARTPSSEICPDCAAAPTTRQSRGTGWGDHAVEPLIAFTAALIYILVTVTAVYRSRATPRSRLRPFQRIAVELRHPVRGRSLIYLLHGRLFATLETGARQNITSALRQAHLLSTRRADGAPVRRGLRAEAVRA